ncbi:MAG: hypothetical protein QM680_14540 [Luteolibacter sp.]
MNPVLRDDATRQRPAIDAGSNVVFRIGVFSRNLPLDLAGYSGFVLRVMASAEIDAELVSAEPVLVEPLISRADWESKTAWHLVAHFSQAQTNFQLNTARAKLWCVLSAIDPDGGNVTLGKGDFWMVRDNSAPGAIIPGKRYLTDEDTGLLSPDVSAEAVARAAADSVLQDNIAAEAASRAAAVTAAQTAAAADATAKANAAVASAIQRSNHTGTQPISTVAGLQAALDGLASGQSDAQAAIDAINALLASDDSTLDELQEIVDFIKLNRADLDALSIDAIAGLRDALDDLDASVSAEAVARAAADSVLQDNIAAEAASRAAAVTAAQTAAAADATAKANAAVASAIQRSNHTGTQPISTVAGLQATLDAKAATADLGTAATRDVGTAEGDVPVYDASGNIAQQIRAVNAVVLCSDRVNSIVSSGGFTIESINHLSNGYGFAVHSGQYLENLYIEWDTSVNVDIGIGSGDDRGWRQLPIIESVSFWNAASLFYSTSETDLIKFRGTNYFLIDGEYLPPSEHVEKLLSCILYGLEAETPWFPSNGVFECYSGFTAASLATRDALTDTYGWTIISG